MKRDMQLHDQLTVFDSLYGKVEFSQEVSSLIQRPPVQRLRHIRLSNIDSPTMPGIANISRYEHALGTCYLSRQMPFLRSVSAADGIVIQSAALLHDWAITPFGHLVEEALNYLAKDFDHEKKLEDLLSYKELGGPQHQLLYGREANLETWSRTVFGADWKERLSEIKKTISGEGRFGPCVAGTIDLDNIDNVVRIAYHMGISVDRTLPTKIAAGTLNCTESEGLLFDSRAIDSIASWLELRKQVYTHLMLSRVDFAGKLMLIYATIVAYQQGVFDDRDWLLNDIAFLECLVAATDTRIAETVKRWLLGERWNVSSLMWFAGSAPSYSRVYEYGKLASDALKRECFAYRIADKRTRLLTLRSDDGRRVTLGRAPERWLLGVGSPLRQDFKAREEERLTKLASVFFNTESLGRDTDGASIAGRLFD
jgi:HD superfamily phosphohydrolase